MHRDKVAIDPNDGLLRIYARVLRVSYSSWTFGNLISLLLVALVVWSLWDQHWFGSGHSIGHYIEGGIGLFLILGLALRLPALVAIAIARRSMRDSRP
jgi:hypothetical protein